MSTSPPNNPVLPSGSLAPYSDEARTVNLEKKIPLPSRDRVHLVQRVHMKIMALQWAGFLALVYVGYTFGDFWTSVYFSFGTPVVTQNVTIFDKWDYWLKIALFALDRLVAAAGTQVVNAWRERVVFNENIAVHERQTYGLVMFVFVTDHLVNWMRFAVMVVFIYVQFDFALAFAVPDIIIACGTNMWSINRYIEAHVACDRGTRKPLPARGPEQRLNKQESAWNASPIAITALQWVMVLAYVLVFYFTDFFSSPYFYFGVPFTLFGRSFKNWRKLVGFVLFAFADSFIASTYAAIVGPYIVTYILNNSNRSTRYTVAGERFVYLGKRIFGWIRIIFMLNFTNSKFMFLLAMFLGDFFVTTWMSHRAVVARHQHPSGSGGPAERRDALAAMPLSVLGISVAVLIELTIVVAVALGQLKVYNLPYFDWPPPLVIFEKIIHSKTDVAFIIFYTVIDRVIYTLTSEITAPYLANVVFACDTDGLRYEPVELLLMTFTNDFTNWVRRVVAFTFQLSNISLVLFQGVTDIALSEMIFERYMRYKTVAGSADEQRRSAAIRRDIEMDQLGVAPTSSAPPPNPQRRVPEGPGPAANFVQVDAGAALHRAYVQRTLGVMTE